VGRRGDLQCRLSHAGALVKRTDLDDLMDELQRGKVYECSLRDPKFRLDGLQHGEEIYIDPRPAILETLCHELLHRRHPRLGERAVTKEARRLLSTMGDADIARWWRAYSRIKKRGVPVDVED
jgi:hypothetical protein